MYFPLLYLHVMARVKNFDKRKQAFDIYRKCRNCTKTAEEMGVSNQLIHLWKKDEDWDEKIRVGQVKFNGFLESLRKGEEIKLIHSDYADYMVLQQLESMALEKVYHEEIIPTNWSDVISTMRFVMEQKRLLTGRPTSHTEKNINVRVGKLSEGELDAELKRTERAIAVIEAREDSRELSE